MTYTVGSLFAGIGGFDLGFERAGFKTVWQVEIDPYCQKVLAKNFPEAERFGDIRECGSHNLKPVDVICGGFPCQDISYCGDGAGLSGERSGLWFEMLRIIREVRPAYILVENVAALLRRGMGDIIRGLAESGYDAEWDCFPASTVGAYHERDRVFIVAYSSERDGQPHDLLEASAEWRSQIQSRRLHRMAVATRAQRENTRLEHEPRLARMVSRIPDQVVRLEALGNAVMPQISEMIARRIKKALEAV